LELGSSGKKVRLEPVKKRKLLEDDLELGPSEKKVYLQAPTDDPQPVKKRNRLEDGVELGPPGKKPNREELEGAMATRTSELEGELDAARAVHGYWLPGLSVEHGSVMSSAPAEVVAELTYSVACIEELEGTMAACGRPNGDLEPWQCQIMERLAACMEELETVMAGHGRKSRMTTRMCTTTPVALEVIIQESSGENRRR
jgi:hypothetical protein